MQQCKKAVIGLSGRQSRSDTLFFPSDSYNHPSLNRFFSNAAKQITGCRARQVKTSGGRAVKCNPRTGEPNTLVDVNLS